MDFPDNLKRVECPEPAEGLSFVYILRCQNGSLYVGYARDLRQRLLRHSQGSGARHTRLLKGFDLVYVEGPLKPLAAVRREAQLKKWSKAKKLALIRGDIEKLKRLAKSRD